MEETQKMISLGSLCLTLLELKIFLYFFLILIPGILGFSGFSQLAKNKKSRKNPIPKATLITTT